MDNECLIYWNGKPVGIETAGRITWFTNATPEIIEELTNGK